MIDPDVARNELQVYEDHRIVLEEKSGVTYLVMVVWPILGLIFSNIKGLSWPILLLPVAIAGLFSGITYYNYIYAPFAKLKSHVKASILLEFMTSFHPKIKYKYFPNKKDVERIVRATNLISVDNFHEEDVIIGELDNATFYLSEIELKKDEGEDTITVFNGLLLSLSIEGKDFPLAQVQSKMGFLNRLFNDFQNNSDFDFWYDTTDEVKFNKELEPLFPFIEHLMKTHGDIRIKTAGSTITILLASSMKLLDDPKFKLENSFFNAAYYDKLGVQLNSLLFIVESFVHGLDRTEIEERLELKALEYAESIGVKIDSNEHRHIGFKKGS